MAKAFYDSEPPAFSEVGNGSVRYCYNIERVTVEAGDDSSETTTQWQCNEVVVWKPLTANKVVQAVLTHEWDSDYEQKLVNEYNAAQLGLYADDSDKAAAKTEAYNSFLTERIALKASVEADCTAKGLK